ncbi:MAG: LamG-like jellyroll fold domain-containing protein [Paludibacteraceae bacterium]
MRNNYSFSKAIKRVLLVALSALLVNLVFAVDITTGLMTHYSFESVSGSIVTDDSGNGNSGTFMGSASTVAGHSGSAGYFATADDYMTLPEGLINSLTSFTISTWVNLNTVPQWARIFDFGSGQGNYLFLTPKGGSSVVRFAIKNGGGEEIIDGKAALPTEQWVHVAITYSYNSATSKGTGTLFVNGSQVGSNSSMTITPVALPQSTQNYIAKSQYSDPGLDGSVDDFRIYNRALSTFDVMSLAGIPNDLINTYDELVATTLKADGDLSNVTTNLNLPTALASPNVAIVWKSSNKVVLDSLGNVTRPQSYDATAKLTATLTQTVSGVTYTLTKDFNATVKALVAASEELAQWNFAGNLISLDNGNIKVADAQSGFVGTVMNDARVRTIGTSVTGQFNVLDLGNGKGYLDMGTEIGEAIYSLSNYTMCGYFFIQDDYAELNSNGNFYWTFSNSDNSGEVRNGYIIGSLKNQAQNVTPYYWNSGDLGVGLNTNAPKGAWHHIAYVQYGNTGTLYIDGAQAAQNTSMTNIPSVVLPKEGFTGTLYNWLGRSNYKDDVYLRKTMLYDFRVLTVALSESDINLDYLMVASTLDELNNAYITEPDYIANELVTERDNLSLGDLSAVTSNLTLPSQGSIDPAIAVLWRSSNTNLIADNGTVTRPDYFNYGDTLTATLFKNGQSVTKKFYATVVAKDGTTFANDLLVKYDFSQSTDSIVTDVAEKHFQGVARNNSSVNTIGLTTKYNVLNLGDSIGYFDLGTEVGKLMYNLNDFTISAYYRINENYEDTELAKNGNFLWTLSNSKDILTTPTGYLIASLKNQAVTITPIRWEQEQTVKLDLPAQKGGWHNLTYTQSGTTGTLYVDGIAMASGEITSLPANTLIKEASFGTAYNWLGRSCYTGDVYLRNTLLYDFRLYKVALTESQIMTSELNIGTTINALDNAYLEYNETAVPSISDSPYKVATSKETIKVLGLKGDEKVSLHDISGRNIMVKTPSNIAVNPGIYIVRINNFASKVIVK